MTDKKKSIIEEALAEFNLIEETINSNAKEILRSVAKEEINSTLNESLYEDEDEYDIEDIEDVDSDVSELPIDDSPEMTPEIGGEEGGSEELGLDDNDMDSGEEGIDLGTDTGSEDYGLDMTGASDEEVISVYKKLSGDDEIEIVSSDEVIIKDPESGSEYNIKMNGGGTESLIDQGEIGVDDFDAEPEMEIDSEMGGDSEMEIDSEMGDDSEMEIDSEMGDDSESDAYETEGDETEGDESEDDDELGESVVYEIELSDDEDIVEDIVRGKGHDKELVNTSAPNSGDIEGQKAPEDKDSGDNLTGGFDDKAQNGSGDNHAKHIMEDEEAIEESEEAIEESEEVDEQIAVGTGQAFRQKGTKADKLGQPQGAGSKAYNKGKVTENVNNKKLTEAVKKYNSLLTEARALKAENVTFKNALKDFRKTITETAVFNINLTHATKLFLEHSTTSEEKKNILSRFDNEVSTIEESKKLYKRINSELGNKTPITESVSKKIMSEQTSGKSSQINETVAYVDPAQQRVLDLMKRTSK